MWSSIILSVLYGYRRILKCKAKSQPLKSVVLQTSKDITKSKDIHSFDSDSEVIIVDNSANCLVWKDRSNFIPETYVTLSKSTSLTFDTAAGTGNAVGVGDLAISWKDDNEKTHNFVLKNAFHILDSPVNILGISAFSKCIGDHATKGTRINSSGQDLIFTWDNGKYQWTFSHCNANMPTLPMREKKDARIKNGTH